MTHSHLASPCPARFHRTRTVRPGDGRSRREQLALKMGQHREEHVFSAQKYDADIAPGASLCGFKPEPKPHKCERSFRQMKRHSDSLRPPSAFLEVPVIQAAAHRVRRLLVAKNNGHDDGFNSV